MAVRSYKSKYTGDAIENLLDNMNDIVEVKDDIVLAGNLIEDIQNLDSTIIVRVANLEERVAKIEDVSAAAALIEDLDKKVNATDQKIEALKTGTVIPLANKVATMSTQYNDLEERVTVVEDKIEVFATTEDINNIVKS